MPQATVGKWGRSLAVRLPGDIARAAGVKDGGRVEIMARDGTIVIRATSPRFTLAELFEGKAPAEWREAYAGAFDWEPDLGREVVEE